MLVCSGVKTFDLSVEEVDEYLERWCKGWVEV